jgi:thioredoxin-related protein
MAKVNWIDPKKFIQCCPHCSSFNIKTKERVQDTLKENIKIHTLYIYCKNCDTVTKHEGQYVPKDYVKHLL